MVGAGADVGVEGLQSRARSGIEKQKAKSRSRPNKKGEEEGGDQAGRR